MGQGAGALRRLFVREVTNALARALLENAIREGDTVRVGESDGRITVCRDQVEADGAGRRRRPPPGRRPRHAKADPKPGRDGRSNGPTSPETREV